MESIVHVPSEDAENAMKSANASSTPTSVSIKRLGTEDGDDDDDDTFLFRSKDEVVVSPNAVDEVLLSFPKLKPLSLVVVVPNDNPPPVVSLLVVPVFENMFFLVIRMNMSEVLLLRRTERQSHRTRIYHTKATERRTITCLLTFCTRLVGTTTSTFHQIWFVRNKTHLTFP